MGVFADVIKVMKSKIFKNLLENGNYKVSHSKNATTADIINGSADEKKISYSRPVWFSNVNNTVKMSYDVDFGYDPVSGTLKAKKLDGTAEKANNAAKADIINGAADEKKISYYRPVWFSNVNNTVKMSYDTDFGYDPVSGTLKVKKVNGDSNASEYLMSNRTMTEYTAGSAIQAGLLSVTISSLSVSSFGSAVMKYNFIVDLCENHQIQSSVFKVRTNEDSAMVDATVIFRPLNSGDGLLRFTAEIFAGYESGTHTVTSPTIKYKYLSKPYEISM